VCPEVAGSKADLDGYYRDLKDVDVLEHGHDNPNSIDYSRAANDLRQLKLGQATLLPVYRFEIHPIVGTRHCEPKSLILVEGLFVFADPNLRDLIDIKFWMEAAPAEVAFRQCRPAGRQELER